MLASWLSDKKDVAESLADFEHTFSGARGKRLSTRRRSAQEFEQQVRKVHRDSLSSDEGLGTSIGSPSDKSLSQKFERALDLLSDRDSGYASAGVKELGHTSEDDDLPRDLIQGWLVRCLLMCSVNIDSLFTDSTSLPAQPRNNRLAQKSQAAVTHSVAPPTKRRHPPLSNFARKKISQNVLGPILRDERFEDFHPLVSSLGSKTNKAVRCLRDLEQSLIFQPVVSNLLQLPDPSSSDITKTLSIPSSLYRAFGEFSIQLVVDTYNQLSEVDQRRAADRPYDNGYFLDLVQQVGRLAAQVGRKNTAVDTTDEEEETPYSPEDEVTLEGGLGTSGELAELVRWRNGKGISLRTGMPYQPTPGIKREASSMLDDDAARSMARRKKGYIPEIIEMACSDKTCGKIFTRKCDLAKHEKTHSRPFKCPETSCKYNELGLPTEKERDRHINDKHDPDPKFYKCMFCEFRTKRQSNCKQHMEKKHDWEYARAKGKDKSLHITPAQTPQTPSMNYSSGMQSPAMSYKSSAWDETSSIAGSVSGNLTGTSAPYTPYEQPLVYDFNQPTNYTAPLFPRETNNQAVNYNGFDAAFNQYQRQPYISPTNTTPISPNIMGTPITPAYSNITGQSPYLANMDITMDYSKPNEYHTLPTPDSFLQPHSRNPSISHQSPMMYDNTNDVNFNDPMIGQGNLPHNDFDLFAGDNTYPFSNPAAASATLFPTQDDFASLNNDPMFDEGFVDFDMEN